MTYEQLIAYGYKKLNDSNLDPNLAYKTLFTIDFHINDYDQYMKLRNNDVSEQIIAKYQQTIEAFSINNQPFARVFGFDYFLKTKFFVLPSVFIFRSETELLVQETLTYLTKYNSIKKVADFCAGTGAVGLSLKKAHPDIDLTCLEYDHTATENIKLNALYHNLNINLIHTDLKQYLKQNKTTKYDLIVCNPPYITQSYQLEESLTKNDPIQALVDFDSENGLSFYELIIDHIDQIVNPDFVIIFEIGFDQKPLLIQLLKQKNVSYYYYFIKDYNNIDRILVLTNLK